MDLIADLLEGVFEHAIRIELPGDETPERGFGRVADDRIDAALERAIDAHRAARRA